MQLKPEVAEERVSLKMRQLFVFTMPRSWKNLTSLISQNNAQSFMEACSCQN